MNTQIKVIKTLFFILCLSTTLTSQGELFWADVDQGKIKKQDLNGENEPIAILEESSIRYHVTNLETQKIYWTDTGKSLLATSNLDGTDVTVLIENLEAPQGITLSDNGDIYFIDADKIKKANSDGSNVEVILDGLEGPRDILYWNDLLYWSDVEEDEIETIGVDGSNRTRILKDVFNPVDLEINKEDSELFWIQSVGAIPGSGIFKSNLDGSNDELVLEEFANGISVDGESGLLYYSGNIFNTITVYDLTDQTSTDLINTYLPNPRTISLNKEDDRIYFVDRKDGGLIFRAKLSTGNTLAELIRTDVHRPERIEVDTINAKIYWINAKSASSNDDRTEILRADLDGQNIEVLISNPDIRRPVGLTLDVHNNQMYWTDLSSEQISRANLDGSNQETIVDNLDNPTEIAINFDDNKIYWGDWGTDKIQRADLDGQNIEDIVSEDLSTPASFAIYYKESKLYWADRGTRTIQRSNYDGSDVETVQTVDDINSIFIDQMNDKLYFSIDHFINHKIQRSDMDGQNIEDIIIDEIRSPEDLFLVNSVLSATSNLANDLELFSFPNPLSDVFTIHSKEGPISQITIRDNTGKMIITQRNINSSSYSMNTESLQPGIYFVSVFVGNSFKTIRAIKA